MAQPQSSIEQTIKQKIVEIVARMGGDASDLETSELIPSSGVIDSAGLIELIAWYEDFYGIQLSQEEITIDTLGTIELMASFLRSRKDLG